jgi:hypothetical protein
MKSFKKSASLNATSEAMEADTIQKNGVSLKSQRVGINFLATERR